MRDKKRVDPNVRGDGKELGGVKRGETLIRIYSVRKKIYFKRKTKKEEKMKTMTKKMMRTTKKRRKRKKTKMKNRKVWVSEMVQ